MCNYNTKLRVKCTPLWVFRQAWESAYQGICNSFVDERNIQLDKYAGYRTLSFQVEDGLIAPNKPTEGRNGRLF